MQKRKIKGLDRLEIGEQGKAQATAKAGRKNSLRKSRKASSQRQQNSGKANAGKKQRGGQRRQAFKLSDHLSDETIKKLMAIKEAEKENGRTKLKRPTNRK